MIKNTPLPLFKIFLLALLSLGFSNPAWSEIINFESTSVGAHPSISSNGFKISSVYRGGVFIRNTHTHALQAKWGDTLLIKRVNGAAFDLTSFNYKSQWSNVGGTAKITAYLANGSTLTSSFTHSGNTATTSKKTLNWRQLTRVEIQFQTTAQLDNIEFGGSQPPTSSGIDFEQVSVGSHPSVSSNGFKISPRYKGGVFIRNSHTHALQPKWGDTLLIKRSNGTPFDLTSFNYKSQWANVGGTAQITGFLANGAKLTSKFTHSGNIALIGKKILNWRNLSRVEIRFQTTAQVDNFIVTRAPQTQKKWKRTNPGAGGTINMIGATASGALLTASDLSGVYINADGTGNRWDALGEANGLMNTHASALGFHPRNGSTFYVGTGTGVYKTSNKGRKFNFISSKITRNNSVYDPVESYDDRDTYIESIVVSKTKPNTVYVAYHKWDTDSPSSVAKSTDGGSTWTDVSFPANLRPANLRIVKLLVHPRDENLIYAIAGKPRWGCSPAKAYRSINGGASWMQLDNKGDVLDLDIAADNKQILYMTTFKAAPCSQNPSFEEYVLFNDSGKAINGNLFKSTNMGNSFGSPIFNQTGIISVGTRQSSNIKLINTLTFASSYWMGDNITGSWESKNAGGTWRHIGTVADWTSDIGYGNNPYAAYGSAFNGLNKTLTKDIFNADRLYGAGGWTIATFDGGKTFKSLSTKKIGNDTWKSTGLENINGFALDVNDNDPKVIYMGGYDIGFWVSRDRGLSWKWQYPFKNNLVTLNRYTWGATESYESYEPAELKTIGGSNVMTLISDPDRANVVWSSFAKAQAFDDANTESNRSKNDRSGLFRSTNYGNNWTLSPIFNKNGRRLSPNYHAVIYGLSIDKNSVSGNRVLYVTIDGHVAKSIDDGKTWRIIHNNGGLKFTAVSGGVLYAGGKSGLWRFKNNSWKQMGGALKTEMMGKGAPMIRDLTPQENETHYDANWNEVVDRYAWNGVHDIQIDPTNPDIVFVTVYGEGKGLYKTIDGGNRWTRVSLGRFESKYLRYIAINPKHPENIFVTSSESINSGGYGGTSKGIFYSNDGGSSWQEANAGMAWKYGSKIEIDNASERVWAWSPGTGVQYMQLGK